MGSWGENNFENDDALNMLGTLFQRIIKDIRGCFDNYLEPDELISHGEANIVANIEIIVILSRNCKTYPDLETDEIEKWFKVYLTAYDKFRPIRVDMLEKDKQSIMIRRSVIITTFYQLLRLVDELWAED